MISVTMLTKNSETYLQRILERLSSFDEVLICDTGSIDRTCVIAESFSNVRLIHHPFVGFGPTHNIATEAARNDWIFSLDSDEIPSEALCREIGTISFDPCSVYSFSRHNYYKGKHIRGCGWFPDRVIRVYHRQHTRFSDDLVHERVLSEGLRVMPLASYVTHIPYDSVSAFLNKMQSYSDLFAHNRKKKSSIRTAVLHALFAFFRAYILQRGFLLGGEGVEIAWFQMNCAFYKYAKMAEIYWNEQQRSEQNQSD